LCFELSDFDFELTALWRELNESICGFNGVTRRFIQLKLIANAVAIITFYEYSCPAYFIRADIQIWIIDVCDCVVRLEATAN